MERQENQVSGGLRRSRLLQGPLRAFAYPRYAAFWSISLLSIMSFFMVMIARGWLILELTDSPFKVAAVQAAQLVPMLVLPLISGALADRGGRKMLLLTTDVFNFISLLAMGALVYFEFIQEWHVFALALANGVAFSFAMPARTSVVPDLVRRSDVASAVALFSTIFSLGQVAGPTPAGYIIEFFGMAHTFFVASLLLIPALIGIAMFDIPIIVGRQRPAPDGARESMAQSILYGIRYVRGQPVIIALLLLGLIVMTFVMPFQAVMPVLVRDVLNRGPDDLGVLMTAIGVGALMGSLTAATARGMPQLTRLMMVAGLLVGVILTLFAVSNFYLLSLALATCLGLSTQLFMTSNMTMVQLATPDYVRARVISIRFILVGLGPVGIMAMGIAAETFGAVPSIIAMSSMNIFFVAVVLVLFPSIRRARRTPPVVEQAELVEPAEPEAQPSG
ncbi:MAG: MFS transporter [Chloroflexota bacterium]|nr:MFS transporter [Chloroflexota bacterium]